jgi:hypothetical protein
MWGPSLFFITILLVTPGGREILAGYIGFIFIRFEASSPYTYMSAAFMCAFTLIFLRMVRRRQKEIPNVCYTFREIRGPAGDEHPKPSRRRFEILLRLRSRLRPVATHQS